MKKPKHPGIFFKERHLKNVTLKGFSLPSKFSRQYWGDVFHGRKRVTAKLALYMAEFSGTNAEEWSMMQARYDVWEAGQRKNYRR